MPMGTTSYLFLSMAWKTDAAESSEISCSPLRPPKRIPTRNFFIEFQCGRAASNSSIAGVVRDCEHKATASRIAFTIRIPKFDYSRNSSIRKLQRLLLRDDLHIMQRRRLAAVRMANDLHDIPRAQSNACDRPPRRGVPVHLVGRQMIIRRPRIDQLIVDQ